MVIRWMIVVEVVNSIFTINCITMCLFKHNRPLWVAVQGLIRPTPYTYMCLFGPIQWISGALSSGVKLPGREADHLPSTSAEIKKTWIYTSTPQYAFMA
jgi:hypothetical protein